MSLRYINFVFQGHFYYEEKKKENGHYKKGA